LTGVVAGVVRLRGVVVVAGLLAGLLAGLVEGRLVLPPIMPPPVIPLGSCCAIATLPLANRNTIADRPMNRGRVRIGMFVFSCCATGMGGLEPHGHYS
jgi:hypothetical protein